MRVRWKSKGSGCGLAGLEEQAPPIDRKNEILGCYLVMSSIGKVDRLRSERWRCGEESHKGRWFVRWAIYWILDEGQAFGGLKLWLLEDQAILVIFGEILSIPSCFPAFPCL